MFTIFKKYNNYLVPYLNVQLYIYVVLSPIICFNNCPFSTNSMLISRKDLGRLSFLCKRKKFSSISTVMICNEFGYVLSNKLSTFCSHSFT